MSVDVQDAWPHRIPSTAYEALFIREDGKSRGCGRCRLKTEIKIFATCMISQFQIPSLSLTSLHRIIIIVDCNEEPFTIPFTFEWYFIVDIPSVRFARPLR